jgi:SOS-response transcriptional repressor LexA
MTQNIRPTKKQRELLAFIEQFIGEHGYSPSYREIMTGLNYTSVATVALHINSLIKRGHLRKRSRSARSLEVVSDVAPQFQAAQATPHDEKWLVDKIEQCFAQVEAATELAAKEVDELYVLIGALKILGFDGAVQAFIPRLSALKARLT